MQLGEHPNAQVDDYRPVSLSFYNIATVDKQFPTPIIDPANDIDSARMSGNSLSTISVKYLNNPKVNQHVTLDQFS